MLGPELQTNSPMKTERLSLEYYIRDELDIRAEPELRVAFKCLN